MSISNRKVVIVGAGHVGSHVGYALFPRALRTRSSTSTPTTQRQSHRRST
nr:hypothetical protein [Butyricicoccus sp. AF10-3]